MPTNFCHERRSRPAYLPGGEQHGAKFAVSAVIGRERFAGKLAAMTIGCRLAAGAMLALMPT
jgi:hypothetical protein